MYPRISTIIPVGVLFVTIFVATSAFGADEEEIGAETDKKIVAQFGLYEDKKIQSYVEDVGQRVLSKVGEPEYDYHFKVLDNEMVNAFALPGGYIYVTRGLLAAVHSEAGLAGVIGHEIGHVIGHHAMKQMKRSLGSMLLTLGAIAASKEVRENAAAWLTVTTSLSSQIMAGYGREMEMESDQIGMITAHEAGYDPVGIVNFLHTMRMLEQLGAQTYHGFMATHPDTVTRIIGAEEKASLLQARDEPYKLYRERYLDAIEGLRYGKPKWRKRTYPPYVIHIHTVMEKETFRSIARDVSKDEALGIEIAALNNMDVNDELQPGYRIKTIVSAESVTKPLLTKRKKEKKDEVGSGTGNGKGGKGDRGREIVNSRTKGKDRKYP